MASWRRGRWREPSDRRTSVRVMENAAGGISRRGALTRADLGVGGQGPDHGRLLGEKHGLQAIHAERHAPKGGIAPDVLRALVEEGLSIRQIGERIGRSPGTVRHWLRYHGLRPCRQGAGARTRGKRGEDPDRAVMTCKRHGTTEFWLGGPGVYRCCKCRSEAVSRRRRRDKEILVARLVVGARSAATTATSAPSSSITGSRRARGSASRTAGRPDHSTRPERRPANGSSSARIATPRWRPLSSACLDAATGFPGNSGGRTRSGVAQLADALGC